MHSAVFFALLAFVLNSHDKDLKSLAHTVLFDRSSGEDSEYVETVPRWMIYKFNTQRSKAPKFRISSARSTSVR